jgi:hypothetical protein
MHAYLSLTRARPPGKILASLTHAVVCNIVRLTNDKNMATTASSPLAGAQGSSSPADQLTTQEKLLLAQAVYKVGAAEWTTISSLLTQHPICTARPAALFSAQSCEKLYVALMTVIGQNV